MFTVNFHVLALKFNVLSHIKLAAQRHPGKTQEHACMERKLCNMCHRVYSFPAAGFLLVHEMAYISPHYSGTSHTPNGHACTLHQST